jgi:hypothetical protein
VVDVEEVKFLLDEGGLSDSAPFYFQLLARTADEQAQVAAASKPLDPLVMQFDLRYTPLNDNSIIFLVANREPRFAVFSTPYLQERIHRLFLPLTAKERQSCQLSFHVLFDLWNTQNHKEYTGHSWETSSW